MPAPTQYATAGGPLIALAALVVIVLICRWVFSTSHRDKRPTSRGAHRPGAQRPGAAQAPGSYGLLVPVATVRTQGDADLLRGVLRDAGIRATVSDGQAPDERVVLVFSADADRARSAVSR